MRAIPVLAALSLALGACTQADPPAPVPQVDEAYFRCKVQPVVTKWCSSFACHGDARRYFHVFARNRLRAGGTESERNAPLTDAEREANFEAARAMLGQGGDPGMLLLKPLEQDAGGYFHRGATLFGGGNVFSSQDDPEYQVLVQWASGAKEDPACIEPGSTQ
jgi:hypothetical protein